MHLTLKSINECLIHSYKYRYEYLYVLNDKTRTNNNLAVYLHSLKYVNDFNQIKWQLKQATSNSTSNVNHSDKYLIRNVYSGQYLCSSRNHVEKVFKLRRQIIMSNNDKLSKRCIWRMHQVYHSNDKYVTLWNYEFDEPLYGSASFFNIASNVSTKSPNRLLQRNSNQLRNLYTWRYEPNSNQFIWIIDCGSSDDYYFDKRRR